MSNLEEKPVVWKTRLDDRFDIQVSRISESGGNLTIKDGDKFIYSEVVSLAYGAVLGPDIDDVRAWQVTSLKVVDRYTGKSKSDE